MKWTDEKPSEPGWYWYKPAGGRKVPYILEVVSIRSRFLGRTPNGLTPVDYSFGQWSGPIPEPEP